MNWRAKIYLALCYFLLPQPCVAQEKAVFILALNPNECSACFNGLKALEAIDKQRADVTVVFRRKYRVDSAELIRSLYLDQYALKYVFSDSLYDRFIIDRSQSSFVFYDKAAAKYGSSILKSMSDKTISALVSGNVALPEYDKGSIQVPVDPDRKAEGLPFAGAQETDTFRFDDMIFRPGVERFIVHSGCLYTLNANFNTIGVYDLKRRKQKYQIDIPRALMLRAYRQKFGAQWPESNLDLMKANRVVKIAEIVDFKVNSEGNVYAMLNLQAFFPDKNNDTFLMGFSTLLAFKEDKVAQLWPLDLVETGDYTFIYRDFNIYRQRMYTNVFKTAYKKQSSNKFIGLTSYKENRFVAEDTLQYDLPEFYSLYNYNFIVLAYWKNYVSLKTIDRFFAVDHNEVIDVGHFPKQNYVDGDIYSIKYGMLDFRIDQDYVYYTYWRIETKRVFCLRFNRKKRTVECDREIFAYGDSEVTANCVIDEQDYSRIYFALDPYTLVTKKIK